MIHNYYVLRGGEDVVFEQELAHLKKAHDVEALVFYNKTGWKGALEFVCSIWNVLAASRLRNKIKSFKPEVIHVHNFHFSSGPILIRTAKKMNVPLVLTLHNYRLLCPSATLMHEGKVFTESLSQNFPWKAVKKKVYRGSILATFWLALTFWFHRKIGTWKQVDRYIALTEFSKNLFLSSKLNVDAMRMVVKANFVEKLEAHLNLNSSSFLFVGRLSQEKGIHILLAAFKDCDAVLNIVGDGPLGELVCQASSAGKNIHYLGNLKSAEVRQVMAQSTALIVPSIWYEGMPMTILEAFSLGLPVLASNIGALSTMINHGHNGLHFVAGDSASLISCVKYWASLSPKRKMDFSEAVYRNYLGNYTPEENIRQLVKIYQTRH
ncbi:glycosyltransferase [Pedobacter sp.]|uniref:glycosyltransferase n=1 Tax=Pedobacter sp. TaxID=1411316 RepID=UPI003D7FF776